MEECVVKDPEFAIRCLHLDMCGNAGSVTGPGHGWEIVEFKTNNFLLQTLWRHMTCAECGAVWEYCQCP